MLPHKHFVIATVLTLIISFFFELTGLEMIKWVLISGVLSVLVDLDVAIMTNLNKRFKQYTNPVDIFKDFDGYLRLLVRSGFIRLITVTHIILSLFFVGLAYFYFNFYFFPVLIAVVSHLLGDIWMLRKFYK